MPTENRSIPIHADDEAAILKMHTAFLDRPAEERGDASVQLQDEAYALGRARGKADQAEQDQGEYPPCDYCGIVPDYHPWHGSGLLDGVENRHIHACEGCRGKLPAHPGQHQGEPVHMVRTHGSSCWEEMSGESLECCAAMPDEYEVRKLYRHPDSGDLKRLVKANTEYAERHLAAIAEAEQNKRAMLAFAATLGEVAQALGIDDHSEPDMIIEAAKSMADGLNRIVQECPLGTPGFAIACEVLGELGVQQDSTESEAKS